MAIFFAGCKTLEELKKAYRMAAVKYHPDHGGDTVTMQQINASYDARKQELEKAGQHRAAEPTADDWEEEQKAVHEYEVRINARKKAWNTSLRRRKQEILEEMEKDPEFAELVRMNGDEISYSFLLIQWACHKETIYEYYQARNYVSEARATLKSKEQVIRWETWEPASA